MRRIWHWFTRLDRCDACNRRRPTYYSGEHGAWFCLRHWRENNQ